MDTKLESDAKKYILSILTSTPLVSTVKSLSSDYKNLIGNGIPYQRLGYNSIEHFLKSITDTVYVNGQGPDAQVQPVVSQKSAHMNSLVTNQKVAVKTKKYGYTKPTPRRRYQSSVQKMVYPPPIPQYQRPSPQYQVPPRLQDQKPSTAQYQKPSTTQYQNPPTTQYQNPPTTQYQNPPTTQNHKPSITQDKPITWTSMNSSTKKGSDFSISRLKIRSASPEPEVSVNEREPNVNKNVLIDKMKLQNYCNIPMNIQNNLKRLIQRFPDGLWCADLPHEYRKLYHTTLKYQDYGFGTLMAMCGALFHIFHYTQPSTDDFKLYDKSKPLPNGIEVANNKSLNTDVSDVIGVVLKWSDYLTLLPSDILPLGESIQRQFVPSSLKKDDIIDVVVAEIYDPSKFWIYLSDSKLDNLMNDMQTFYKENCDRYRIPKNLIKDGLYCVQIIFGEYHRALIVDTLPDVPDQVRVMYVDYGTMTKAPIEGMCFLTQKFSELPAQAIRCRLANIYPQNAGCPWPKEATKRLYSLISSRDISAKIANINKDENYLEVYLADTTGPTIFYINDVLVEEHLAEYIHKEQKSVTIDPNYTTLVKNIHLYPTFFELEYGLVPSTGEMAFLTESNVPINFCFPHYFVSEYTEEIPLSSSNNDTEQSLRSYENYFEIIQEDELDLSCFSTIITEIRALLLEGEEELAETIIFEDASECDSRSGDETITSEQAGSAFNIVGGCENENNNFDEVSNSKENMHTPTSGAQSARHILSEIFFDYSDEDSVSEDKETNNPFLDPLPSPNLTQTSKGTNPFLCDSDENDSDYFVPPEIINNFFPADAQRNEESVDDHESEENQEDNISEVTEHFEELLTIQEINSDDGSNKIQEISDSSKSLSPEFIETTQTSSANTLALPTQYVQNLQNFYPPAYPMVASTGFYNHWTDPQFVNPNRYPMPCPNMNYGYSSPYPMAYGGYPAGPCYPPYMVPPQPPLMRPMGSCSSGMRPPPGFMPMPNRTPNFSSNAGIPMLPHENDFYARYNSMLSEKFRNFEN